MRSIAGVFNGTKNVLGLMPHPENAIREMLGSTEPTDVGGMQFGFGARIRF